MGFAVFTAFCALIILGIYALYTMSNGEGQGFGWYCLHALAPLPIVFLGGLQASCRMSAADGVLIKHDLFTTRYVPAELIDHFTGDNGVGVLLKSGKEFEFWGHGSSLIGEIFSFSASLRTAEKLDDWLEREHQDHEGKHRPRRMRLTVRADAVKVLVVTVIVTLCVAALAMIFGDTLRPFINQPPSN